MRQSETRGADEEVPRGRGSGGAAVLARRLGLLAALVTLPSAIATAPAAAVIPPVVQNLAPVPIAGGVELRARIYTYASDTHYHFEYGTTTAYGTSVPVPDADAGSQEIVTVSQPVTGLTANTTYHYRVLAGNEGGPGMSSDATFNSSEVAVGTSTGGEPPYGGEGGEVRGGGGSTPAKGRKIRLRVSRIGGRRILAAANGHTLYSLSVEKKGRFVCTKSSGCLSLWKPLLVPNGGSVVGPVKLGSIKRPEGGRQATYRGLPLYTFAADRKSGEAGGEGFKDVGTWHAVRLPKRKR